MEIKNIKIVLLDKVIENSYIEIVDSKFAQFVKENILEMILKL